VLETGRGRRGPESPKEKPAMAKTPQSFEKRQRERAKQRKREEKLERRLARSAEKRQKKEEGISLEPEVVERESIEDPGPRRRDRREDDDE
jgi:hypothetical protein